MHPHNLFLLLFLLIKEPQVSCQPKYKSTLDLLLGNIATLCLH